MTTNLIEHLNELSREKDFSGTVFVEGSDGVLVEESHGYANRSDKIKNKSNTRYGIASGCKIFTVVAICQLVQAGKLSFDTTLTECLPLKFPQFDQQITIHHLLTHTSGIPDYFDEDVMDDFEELWIGTPMYHMRNLKDFLSFFQKLPMKSTPGKTFHYNNAGFIVLGLIVEQITGQTFTDYVEENIFKEVGMTASGYFEMDRLPSHTAVGYIDNPDGTWKTNIYSLPAKGGSDGGAFVTARDMVTFWKAVMEYQLLNETLTKKLLTIQVQMEDKSAYGYGVWIQKSGDAILKYHVMGYDPGVSFHSAFYPVFNAISVIVSNKSEGAFAMMNVVEEGLISGKCD